MAVVTGASTGIGRAIAVRLAEAGCDLVIHGRSTSDELSVTKELAERHSVNVHAVVSDFVDQDSSENFFQQVIRSAKSIDVWVNNAGSDVLTGDSSAQTFQNKLEKLFAVDVRSTLLLSRLAGQHWLDNGVGAGQIAGSIVNIGWDQAVTGIEGESGQLFSTIKGSIMAMTQSLAKSFAPTVRVNCVAPGWIKTAWGEAASETWQNRAINESLLKRWGTTQDIANVVAFLASDESQFINGQTINVNGGFAGTST